MSGAYRSAVRCVVGSAAVSYGYTLVTTTTGGVLIESHGPPSVTEAFLFLAGAAAGFTAMALLGSDGEHREHDAAIDDNRWVGASSALSAAVGLGLAALVAHALRGPVAFGVAALLATATYFAAGAAGLSLIGRQQAQTMAPPRPASRAIANKGGETYDHPH